jgi:hypothetical protein
VGGAASISTILLIDVEIGSFPPYIYIRILLGIYTPKKLLLGISVGKS